MLKTELLTNQVCRKGLQAVSSANKNQKSMPEKLQRILWQSRNRTCFPCPWPVVPVELQK